MDKALNYLALARKAGLAELGEEPVGVAAKLGHARLVLVAADGSDHTWRRAKSYVSGTKQQLLRMPYSKDEMGFAVGRTSLAIAAITDAGMGKALVEALEQPQQYTEVLATLAQMDEDAKRRQKEANAHARHKGLGKKKRVKKEH